MAHYALEGPPNKGIAAECRTALPGEEDIPAEIPKTRQMPGGPLRRQ